VGVKRANGGSSYGIFSLRSMEQEQLEPYGLPGRMLKLEFYCIEL
jgi:hypothetical protein